MVKSLNLVWALPVDTAALAARLEAFLETKAVTLTLRICAKKQGSPVPARLPLFIIERIRVAVMDAWYQSNIRGWLTAVDCIRRSCWGTQHEGDEGSHGIDTRCFDKDEEDLYGYRVQNVHLRNVKSYLTRIARIENQKEALTRTLGVSPNFSLVKAARDCNTIRECDEEGDRIESARILRNRIPARFASYLTLPVEDDTILLHHEKGPNAVSYAVKQTITPSCLKPLEADKLALFPSAIVTLRLDQPHIDIMVDDKDEDEWPWSRSEHDAETPGDDNCEDIQRSRKAGKKQHIECLECGIAPCEGRKTLPKKAPELMLLGWGKLEAFDAEDIGSGYFHAL